MRTTIIAFAVLLMTAPARAQDPEDPEASTRVDAYQEHEPEADSDPEEVIDWSEETLLAAAQCLVAESGWRTRTEHSAILHVLERRWRRFNAAHPDARISFVEQVRRYCHVHRETRPSYVTPRMRWVLRLPWGALEADPGMGAGQDWRRWADDWEYARETVRLFAAGELPDPMPLAMIFGGSMDSAAPGLVYLGPWTHDIAPEPGDAETRVLLHNRFYALESAVHRAALARARR